jgi:hypothetical protein
MMSLQNNMYFRDVVFMLIIGMYIQSDLIINGLKNALIDFVVALVGVTILVLLHQRREKKIRKYNRLR